MRNAVHFGAGNIGRGFIGMVLSRSGFHVDFIDINAVVIDALHERKAYDVVFADEKKSSEHIADVDGLNNQLEPAKVVAAISSADIVTTAIGPKVLPFIAPLIAEGIVRRRQAGNETPLDIIACENMIGGSAFLGEHVLAKLQTEDKAFADKFIGFPNAAVDCIVPVQHNDDPLLVVVEPFHEWVIDGSSRKAKALTLPDVHYAQNLEPYIERKLFTVNTGHAAAAYTGAFLGYKTILEAISDKRTLSRLEAVLAETGALITAKWDFDKAEHQKYIDAVIRRFQNPRVSDDICRVARTPVRKLGFNERFIRPIRELRERGLGYKALAETTAYVLSYNDSADEESVNLRKMLDTQPLENVIRTVTSLKDASLVSEIAAHYTSLKG